VLEGMRSKMTKGLMQDGILLRLLVAAELVHVGQEGADSAIIQCALMRSLTGSVCNWSHFPDHFSGRWFTGERSS
jgi:hypothetical protein